jgi:fibronectin-binding autotransporter adhesin
VKLNNGTLVAAQNNTGGPTNSGTLVNSARTLVLGNGTTNNIDAQSGLFFEYNGVIGEENGAGAASAMRFGIAGTREGTVKLGGLNTYDGPTTIVAGTLEISNLANGGQASGIGQSGNAATNLVIGGTLRYTGTSASTDRLFTIGSSGTATIDSGSGNLSFSNTGSVGFASTNLARHDVTLIGTGSGTMALTLANDAQNDPLHVTKSGSGTWTLGGNNDYTGATTIAGGTLQVSSDANLGRTTEGEGLVFNGGTLKTTGSFTNSRAVLLTGTGTVDTTANTLALSGLISGSNALTKVGLGTLILAGNNTFSGGTILSSGGGALTLSTASALGSGNFTQTDGSSTLVIDTTGTITNQMDIYNVSVLQSVTMTGAKTLFNATYNVTNNTTTTEAGDLSGTGGVTKLGTGTLLLSGNNTYGGPVDVQAGLLNLNSSVGGAAASTTSVSVSSGATLLISQNNQVNDSASVSLTGGTIRTATGVSEEFGNLTVTGSGFLDFGTTSYANANTISFGTYAPSALLTINNFDYGSVLTFGSDLSSSINNSSFFTFNNGGIASYSWNSTTSTFTITAIPEPSTYVAAAGLLALMLWPSRRRLLKDARSIFGLRAPMRDRLARKASEVR